MVPGQEILGFMDVADIFQLTLGLYTIEYWRLKSNEKLCKYYQHKAFQSYAIGSISKKLFNC